MTAGEVGMSTNAAEFLGTDLIDLLDSSAGEIGAAMLPSTQSFPLAFAMSEEPAVPVAIEDLLPDALGEVVLSAGEGMTIALSARQEMVETGVADHHVTASGCDVSGFGYYSFSGGLTVYFPHHSLVTLSLDEIA